jgi:hypothetical protein
VTAILDEKNQLHLPAARFTERDRARLAQYLKTLQEEGIDGVTADRGIFGLTEEQFTEVFDELSEEVGLSTANRAPREVVDAMADRLSHRLVIDRALLERLDAAEPFEGELKDLSRGTALAIALRQAGLEFCPRMQSGELLYQAGPADSSPAEPRDRPRSEAKAVTNWPVGWEPDDSPIQTAPELFEMINAQIDGYSLAEAFIDQASLRRRDIDLAKIQVKLPPDKYSYDRILRRMLSQTGLVGALRVDERGTPFYWITTTRP